MRFTGMVLTSMTLGLALLAAPLLAQEKTDEGPTSEKAKKSFNEGNDRTSVRIRWRLR